MADGNDRILAVQVLGQTKHRFRQVSSLGAAIDVHDLPVGIGHEADADRAIGCPQTRNGPIVDAVEIGNSSILVRQDGKLQTQHAAHLGVLRDRLGTE